MPAEQRPRRERPLAAAGGDRALRRRGAGAAALAALVALATATVPAPAAAGFRSAVLWGGDVRALAVHPRDPALVLAGTSAGHVYLSRDGGESWREAGSPLALRGWVVGTLLFDPNRPERLWAGLWGIWDGGTVLYSDDLGASWVQRDAGLPGGQVYALTAVPGAPGRLYAATRAGVYGSDDEGRSWRHLTAAHPEVQNVSSLLVDPYRPATLLAGTWRRAYRSDDAGRSWRGVFDGMVLDTELFSVHANPRQPGEVWASTCGWVYRSTDFGGRWTRFERGLDERRTPSFAVLFDGRLLAGTVAGLYSSDDHGRTWSRRTPPSLSVLAIASHPARPGRVWIGTEGAGVWVSDDGGTSFHPSSRGITNLRVTALARWRDEVLAAVVHAGPGSGVYRSRDGGLSFAPAPEALPTVLGLASVGDAAYAATEQGLWGWLAGRWQRLPELGTERVEQVVAAAGRVVARTAERLYERRQDRFVPVAYRHGPPRSLLVAADALWVSDAAGLYRLAGEENHAIAAPFAGGRLNRLGEALLFTGAGGTWRRAGLEAAWEELPAPGGAQRALETGGQRFPVVLLGAETAALYDQALGRFEPLPLPIPARDVTAALAVDGRLLVGTSGFGLLVRDLE